MSSFQFNCTALAICIVVTLHCHEATAQADAQPVTIQVGSKAFTESVILGEMACQLIETTGAKTDHHRELATNLLWKSLISGEVDIYAEYTGTLMREILASRKLASVEQLPAVLDEYGLKMSAPLGFHNGYALGVKETLAEQLGIRAISDLAAHPELKFGFSSDFSNREDGWKSLRRAYNLPHEDVVGLDHSLAYGAMDTGDLQVVDMYTTDAEIEYHALRALADDRAHFPRYEAVWLYRQDLAERAPSAVEALKQVEGRINETTMIAMNRRAKIDRVDEAEVSAAYLAETLGLSVTVESDSLVDRVAHRTVEHLALVAVSLCGAILVGIPCGIFAANRPRFARFVLGTVGVIQTIPSLVVLVLMIPLLGIGGPPAVAALFLYSLLPIVQNTYAGLHGIAPQIRESAVALGLPAWSRLFKIELPTASRSIIAGVKTSAVINVGTATLGGLIGAGGYGQPIFTGIRLDNTWLMLEGALPAAGLALLLQGLFDLAENRLVPLGLRLRPTED